MLPNCVALYAPLFLPLPYVITIPLPWPLLSPHPPAISATVGICLEIAVASIKRYRQQASNPRPKENTAACAKGVTAKLTRYKGVRSGIYQSKHSFGKQGEEV